MSSPVTAQPAGWLSPKVTRRWSHSAFEDYSACGEKYRLKRIEKVPQQPGVAQVAGKAFHSWSEDYDRTKDDPFGATGGFTSLWDQYLEAALLEEEEQSGLSRDEFKVSGRATKDKPNKEDLTHWRDVLGPELCAKYIEWRDNSDWVIAQDLPQDGNGNTSGIEYEVVYRVGQVELKGYIDRVMYDEHGNLGVVDLKTWARKRITAQLPGYIVGSQKRGIPAVWGSYYEARKGKDTGVKFYTGWNEHRLAALYEQAAVMEAMGFYPPKPSDDCASFCSVRDHCQFRLD